MNKRTIFDGIMVIIAVILFFVMVAFSFILMRYGVFCESQMPSMQEPTLEVE